MVFVQIVNFIVTLKFPLILILQGMKIRLLHIFLLGITISGLVQEKNVPASY